MNILCALYLYHIYINHRRTREATNDTRQHKPRHVRQHSYHGTTMHTPQTQTLRPSASCSRPQASISSAASNIAASAITTPNTIRASPLLLVHSNRGTRTGGHQTGAHRSGFNKKTRSPHRQASPKNTPTLSRQAALQTSSASEARTAELLASHEHHRHEFVDSESAAEWGK